MTTMGEPGRVDARQLHQLATATLTRVSSMLAAVRKRKVNGGEDERQRLVGAAAALKRDAGEIARALQLHRLDLTTGMPKASGVYEDSTALGVLAKVLADVEILAGYLGVDPNKEVGGASTEDGPRGKPCPMPSPFAERRLGSLDFEHLQRLLDVELGELAPRRLAWSGGGASADEQELANLDSAERAVLVKLLRASDYGLKNEALKGAGGSDFKRVMDHLRTRGLIEPCGGGKTKRGVHRLTANGRRLAELEQQQRTTR